MNAELSSLLQRLRRVRPAAPTPRPHDLENTVRQIAPEPSHAGSSAGLRERFVQTASAAGAQVRIVDTRTWPEVVCEILRVRPSGRVAVFAASLPPALAPSIEGLCRELRALGWQVSTQADEDDLFSAAAAVTGAAALIAETGSLVCESGPVLPRGASLIPPLHIVVAGEDQILPDLWDYFAALARRGASLPPAISLITGPSKTADIEGVLVTGVHGPEQVCVVLVAPTAAGERREEQHAQDAAQ
jgi:L-lactate dehydrogenase complex protein LldG